MTPAADLISVAHKSLDDIKAEEIVEIPANHWFHLYNLHDRAFTAQIHLSDPPFQQVPTAFDVDFLDHDAIRYLTHPNTSITVWRALAGQPVARGGQYGGFLGGVGAQPLQAEPGVLGERAALRRQLPYVVLAVPQALDGVGLRGVRRGP